MNPQSMHKSTKPAPVRAGLLVLFLSLLVSALSSCDKKDAAPASSAQQDPRAALVQKGRSVYQAQCIACHNSDPRKAGGVGPDVWGSSRELIEARVLRAEYPAGYKPKRETRVMPAQPQFKNDIDAIHAYLNQ